jgi:hypothetical protein
VVGDADHCRTADVGSPLEGRNGWQRPRSWLHDIGAFNLGLGATLLLTLAWADGLLVALAGVEVGATTHALAHWLDRPHQLAGSV